MPVSPERAVKDTLPLASFLHSPKSDIMARKEPLDMVDDSKTLCGLISRCTAQNKHKVCVHVLCDVHVCNVCMYVMHIVYYVKALLKLR